MRRGIAARNPYPYGPTTARFPSQPFPCISHSHIHVQCAWLSVSVSRSFLLITIFSRRGPLQSQPAHQHAVLVQTQHPHPCQLHAIHSYACKKVGLAGAAGSLKTHNYHKNPKALDYVVYLHHATPALPNRVLLLFFFWYLICVQQAECVQRAHVVEGSRSERGVKRREAEESKREFGNADRSLLAKSL